MYNLYPLLAGFVALPPLQLKATVADQLDQSVLDELVSRYVPSHIFVLVNNNNVFILSTLFISNVPYYCYL